MKESKRAILIICVVLLFLILVFFGLHKNDVFIEDVGTLTNIIYVGDSDLFSLPDCILEINGNKGNYTGSICYNQVGYNLCKYQHKIFKTYLTRKCS